MMVRTFCLLVLTLSLLSGCKPIAAQLYQPVTDTLLLPLGNDTVQVHVSRYGDTLAPFFVHLHHNEQTADSAARHYLQQYGGVLVSFQNNRQRLVKFRLGDTIHQFDPNRMFTDSGAQQSLKLLGPFSPLALQQVRQLGDTLLQLLPDSLPVIAVHNNTNGAYSILSYLAGGPLALEAVSVFRNPQMDADDFVLTTDSTLFDELKTVGLNAVLQHNEQAADDGSLGFVWGKMKRPYTNVEAQHGRWQEQIRMINAVISAWKRPQIDQ